MREAMLMILGGIALGVPCAAAAARLISHILVGVGPLDLLSFWIAADSLLIVGMVASYWPAWHAARVNPMVALRHE